MKRSGGLYLRHWLLAAITAGLTAWLLLSDSLSETETTLIPAAMIEEEEEEAQVVEVPPTMRIQLAGSASSVLKNDSDDLPGVSSANDSPPDQIEGDTAEGEEWNISAEIRFTPGIVDRLVQHGEAILLIESHTRFYRPVTADTRVTSATQFYPADPRSIQGSNLSSDVSNLLPGMLRRFESDTGMQGRAVLRFGNRLAGRILSAQTSLIDCLAHHRDSPVVATTYGHLEYDRSPVYLIESIRYGDGTHQAITPRCNAD